MIRLFVLLWALSALPLAAHSSCARSDIAGVWHFGGDVVVLARDMQGFRDTVNEALGWVACNLELSAYGRPMWGNCKTASREAQGVSAPLLIDRGTIVDGQPVSRLNLLESCSVTGTFGVYDPVTGALDYCEVSQGRLSRDKQSLLLSLTCLEQLPNGRVDLLAFSLNATKVR